MLPHPAHAFICLDCGGEEIRYSIASSGALATFATICLNRIANRGAPRRLVQSEVAHVRERRWNEVAHKIYPITALSYFGPKNDARGSYVPLFPICDHNGVNQRIAPQYVGARKFKKE